MLESSRWFQSNRPGITDVRRVSRCPLASQTASQEGHGALYRGREASLSGDVQLRQPF